MPTFMYKGIECVSAGIIFYTFAGGSMQFLLQRKIGEKFTWEDLGGKSSTSDTSIMEVAAREAAEESNGQIRDIEGLDILNISKKFILKLLDRAFVFINKKIKYVVFVTYLSLDISKLNFDDYEHNNVHNIKRTIELVNLKNIKVGELHPRIRFILKYLH